MQVSRRHKGLVLGIAVLCLVLAIVVAQRVRAGGGSNANDPRAEQENVPYAAIVPVKRQTVSTTLSIAGQFIPYQNVELHAKVAGYIRNINVDIGDRVHKGQVLAVLEIPELIAQVDEAKAAVHHAEEEIQRAQSEVSRAEADNVALHANAVRLVNTDKARPGLIAQQELDDATAKDRASQAQVDAAKSALAAAKQQLAVAKANQEHYSALSNYAQITAPYDGVVTWRFSDTGALVQAGTSGSNGLPVVTLAQINVLRLRIPVPESQIPQTSLFRPRASTSPARWRALRTLSIPRPGPCRWSSTFPMRPTNSSRACMPMSFCKLRAAGMRLPCRFNRSSSKTANPWFWLSISRIECSHKKYRLA